MKEVKNHEEEKTVCWNIKQYMFEKYILLLETKKVLKNINCLGESTLWSNLSWVNLTF